MDARDVDAADKQLRDRLSRRICMHNEAILKIDCALSELPRFEGYNHRDDYLIGSVLIADSVAQVELAHTDPNIGRIPLEDPSMYLVVPSVLDPSLAPEGKHTLWIEYFVPYQIAKAQGTGIKGTGWTEDLKNKVADRVLDKLSEYAPNVKHSIIARRVESPPELEERLGVLKGNYYHLDMTFDQMFFSVPCQNSPIIKRRLKDYILRERERTPAARFRECRDVIAPASFWAIAIQLLRRSQMLATP